jgi:hypothetical protein
VEIRADDGIRTRDPHLGKVMRYQLRYVRVCSVSAACETTLAQTRRGLHTAPRQAVDVLISRVRTR